MACRRCVTGPNSKIKSCLERWRRALAIQCTLQPIRRAGQPDDIAKATVWLANDAASFVTGYDLLVDEGITSFYTRDFKVSIELRAEIGRRMKTAIETMTR